MSLKETVQDILGPSEHLKIVRRKNEHHNYYYEIVYGNMYSSPQLSFAKLVKLSELFGTQKIDVDDYAVAGCESCDFGSDYGHSIQIYEPTLMLIELENECEK